MYEMQGPRLALPRLANRLLGCSALPGPHRRRAPALGAGDPAPRPFPGVAPGETFLGNSQRVTLAWRPTDARPYAIVCSPAYIETGQGPFCPDSSGLRVRIV